ncbi:hypothetical protein KFE25_006259 [Diacronema lutheri]|uniref:Uncharacterized protein n=1 Tax=Diacronema lutheri TaxID=2081491 RepID=A0A8J5Y1W0_DIALT|nr:hypothetical protein KFE25_006259 [Diacronema lutheri]
MGKLLKDQTMNKLLKNFGSRGESEDRMYLPDDSVKAGSHVPRVASFDRALGREVPMGLSGSRLSAPSASNAMFITPEAVTQAERLTRPSAPSGVSMARQLPRAKATTGYLLLNDSMRKLALGPRADGPEAYEGLVRDTMLTPSITRPSLTRSHIDFSRTVGRGGRRSGARLAAMSTGEGHWRPTKVPSIALTRPRSNSSGVGWEKQITRQQAVTGKLLEDQAINKFLNGAGAQGGADFYDADDSYFRRKPSVPDLSRQTDRLTAVSGKLLNDRSYNALMRASNLAHDSAALSSATRRNAARRRVRGEEARRASALAAGGGGSDDRAMSFAKPDGMRLSTSPSAISATSGLRETAMPVFRFSEQLGRVPHHRTGLRSAGAPPVGAAKRADLLAHATDHLFR